MDFESGEQPKERKVSTLRNLTLEIILLNFGKIFSKEMHNKPFKVGRETWKGMYLPPYAFDDILEKSREMSWRISPEELLPCVENLDKLQWKDLSYFTRRVFLRPKDVSFICRKRPTLKSLSVRIKNSDAREVSHCFSEVAGSLERLDLSMTRCDDKATNTKRKDISGLPLFRLKHLTFNQGLGKLPLRVDPETLEHLQVPMNESTKEMIEIFKNIRHLSINHVSGKDKSGMMDVMSAAWKLSELRTLSFTNSRFCREYHHTNYNNLPLLMEQLDYLENVYLPLNYKLFYGRRNDNSHVEKSKISPTKTLKFLAVDEDNCTKYSEIFAEKVVNYDSLKGLLKVPERTVNQDVETFIWKLKYVIGRYGYENL